MAEFNNSREPFQNNVQEINTINIPETYHKNNFQIYLNQQFGELNKKKIFSFTIFFLYFLMLLFEFIRSKNSGDILNLLKSDSLTINSIILFYTFCDTNLVIKMIIFIILFLLESITTIDYIGYRT